MSRTALFFPLPRGNISWCIIFFFLVPIFSLRPTISSYTYLMQGTFQLYKYIILAEIRIQYTENVQCSTNTFVLDCTYTIWTYIVYAFLSFPVSALFIIIKLTREICLEKVFSTRSHLDFTSWRVFSRNSILTGLSHLSVYFHP